MGVLGAVPTRVVLNAHSRQPNLVARAYLWCNMLFSLTACPLFFRYDLFLLMKKTTLQGLYSTTACVPVFSLQKHQLSRTSRSTLKRFASPPKVCVMMICPWIILYIYIQYIFYNIQSSINSPVIYNIFLRIFPQNTKLQFSSTARQPPCLSFHFKGHHRIRVRQLHLALAPGFAFLLYIFARQKLCSQLITEPYREIPSQW